MAEIETREESSALQIASDALDRHMDSMDRELFKDGWLAGRDWARNQDTVQIPLYKRGNVVAYATVDGQDADLLGLRWILHSKGYAAHRTRRETIPMHLVILERRLGRSVGDGMTPDHVDRVRTNNRRSNLREASRREQQGNKGLDRDNTSGFRGVTRHKASGKWQAQGRHNKRCVYLGHFEQAEDAARAYDAWAISHFGPEYARLNFPVVVQRVARTDQEMLAQIEEQRQQALRGGPRCPQCKGNLTGGGDGWYSVDGCTSRPAAHPKGQQP